MRELQKCKPLQFCGRITENIGELLIDLQELAVEIRHGDPHRRLVEDGAKAQFAFIERALGKTPGGDVVENHDRTDDVAG